MKNRIDFRLLAIAGAILSIALAAAWATTALFRYLFPVISAETIWDDVTGPTIASLVAIAIKSLLVRKKIFHLLVTTDVPGISTVNLYLLRRHEGRGLVFKPTFQREAMINEKDTLIRNINWWGVYGVDRCLLCIKFDDNDTNCRYVEIPRSLYRAYVTFQVRLSELSEHQPLVVSRQYIE
jgi:hypothetical protein